ncbi:hypothetical protein OG689_36800 [Kitasatospora sp. NBC_00240]|uniref:hypothetical protein n=1 Tax=Kitasatospora sp. NBC_00240 TaxID=2903567 RepID=UPI0022574430|nr:hypothetical protein [Kitasatospora sp. NBC_00240]MCX5214755.1 hypothetical protein [Kitasatospora sp. NBC_00240]
MTVNETALPVTVALVSGPSGTGSIDDFELFYARRAVARFRERLGRQGLLDLLAADIEEGNAALRESARTSDGSFTGRTTVLATQGLTSGEFLGWMGKAFSDESVLLAAHPEHYSITDQEDGSVHVVENIGPHIASFYLGSWGAEAMTWAEDAAERLPEAEFPHKQATNLFLADGTIIGRVLIQFGDTADGFTSSLSVYMPTSCPDDVLEHHLRHFAIEFRNWITAAAAARA